MLASKTLKVEATNSTEKPGAQEANTRAEIGNFLTPSRQERATVMRRVMIDTYGNDKVRIASEVLHGYKLRAMTQFTLQTRRPPFAINQSKEKSITG